jgi:hypothetical protein
VEIAVRWLQLNHPEEPVGLPKVLKLGKHGGGRRSEKAKAEQAGRSSLKPNEWNTKKHWEMRLADQAPEHLAAFRRGDHKSINAAARAARICSDRPPQGWAGF